MRTHFLILSDPLTYIRSALVKIRMVKFYQSVIGVKSMTLTLRLLMSYIYIYIYVYGAPILDVSRSHTTTHHSR